MSFYPNLVEGSVTVGGHNVRYVDGGTPREGEPPIVMVHGTGGTAESHFSALYSMLAGRHRVVAMDLATPENAGPLELEHLSAQVQAVIKRVSPGEPVILVGYSLGAVVTAATAAGNPALVDRLVLIAGWIRTDRQLKLRNSIWQQLRETGSAALPGFMALLFFGAPFVASLRQDQLEELLAATQPGPGIDAQMDLNRRIDISNAVGRIRARTLVIGGTYDQMVPIRHSRELFGAIADARLAELPAGHALVFERPAELFNLIDTFATSPEPAGSIRVPAVI